MESVLSLKNLKNLMAKIITKTEYGQNYGILKGIEGWVT
jgi:hypothetical protein